LIDNICLNVGTDSILVDKASRPDHLLEAG
jgi:hypothetical protein